MKIDLNADVGEGFDDEPLYALVSSVNVACGAHAGDDESMTRALARAKHHGVAAGAHPGYADRASMGRATTTMPLVEIKALLLDQIEALSRISRAVHTPLHHVKPHGALYNQAATDPILSMVIAESVREAHPMLRLVGLAGSSLPAAGRECKLAVADEAFADRRYRADGTLAPRDHADALIHEPQLAAMQALAIACAEPIDTVDGGSIVVHAQTVCVHGDTPGALQIAHAVRRTLKKAGITIAPL